MTKIMIATTLLLTSLSSFALESESQLECVKNVLKNLGVT
jgi:hypothetical protein